MEQLQNTGNIVHENFMVLYDVFVTFVGFCGFRSKHITSDLDQSRLTDTWSQKMTGSEPIPILSIGSMHSYSEPPVWDEETICVL